MNLNNWKNWGTNLLIRFGLQDPYYAHGFSESDSVIENTQEEDSLSKTFFEWKIGRNWYKPWKWGGGRGRPGRRPEADIEKARREATEKARAEAAEVARKQQAAYDKQQAEIAALKAAQEARKGRATASASQLAIGPGAQDRVGDMKKRKQERRVGTQQTRKTRKPTVIAQGPATGGGTYGGAPVV